MPDTDRWRPVPRYVQIQCLLRERILQGDLLPGTRLAGERQLAREFCVSAVTVSKALAELAREGLLVRQPGGGTFVQSPTASPDAPPRGDRCTLLVDTAPIYQPHENYYMGTFMSGVQAVAAERGCAIRFVPEAGSGGSPAMPRPGEGLLLLAPLADRRDEVAALAQAGVPLVVCGARWPGLDVPTVDSDNVDAARQAVEYLLRLGHRRIVLLTAPPLRTNTRDRVQGYCRTLACHDVGVEEGLIVEAATQEELGEAAADRFDALLRSPRSPAAVFATDYTLALEALARVRALGLHIPNDVSVIGFDDPFSAAHLSPPLTCVRQPIQQMGRRAAERLLGIAGGAADTAGVEVFLCTLVVRGSCRSTRH